MEKHFFLDDNLMVEEEDLSTKMDDMNLLYESENESLFGIYSQHLGIFYNYKSFNVQTYV